MTDLSLDVGGLAQAQGRPGQGPLAYLVRNVNELRRRFGLSLDLELDGRLLHFGRPDDFAFALAGRTAIPHRRLAQLGQFDTITLVREATALRHLEQRLFEALEGSLQGRRSLHDALGAMGAGAFAPEFDWRGLFAALNRLGREFELFRRIAVAKYLQFLGAQQHVIGLFLRLHGKAGASLPESEEALFLDLPEGADEVDGRRELVELRRGEPYELRLPRGEALALRLADRGFSLIAGQPVTLLDERGKVYALASGMNCVGRDLGNDVAVDTAYRTVSRRHLLIEVNGHDRLRLIDLSTHGTWVQGARAGGN